MMGYREMETPESVIMDKEKELQELGLHRVHLQAAIGAANRWSEWMHGKSVAANCAAALYVIAQEFDILPPKVAEPPSDNELRRVFRVRQDSFDGVRRAIRAKAEHGEVYSIARKHSTEQ